MTSQFVIETSQAKTQIIACHPLKIEEKVKWLERKRDTQTGGHFIENLKEDPAYYGPWSAFHDMYAEDNTDPEDLKVIEKAKAVQIIPSINIYIISNPVGMIEEFN